MRQTHVLRYPTCAPKRSAQRAPSMRVYASSVCVRWESPVRTFSEDSRAAALVRLILAAAELSGHGWHEHIQEGKAAHQLAFEKCAAECIMMVANDTSYIQPNQNAESQLPSAVFYYS